MSKTDLGPIGAFMGGVTNFGKRYPTVAQTLFGPNPPASAEYIGVARSTFGSPFFEALAQFCKSEQGAEHFIHRVLGVSLADAKSLLAELHK